MTKRLPEGQQGCRHMFLLSDSLSKSQSSTQGHIQCKTASNILLVGKLKDRVSNSGAFTQGLSSKSLL